MRWLKAESLRYKWMKWERAKGGEVWTAATILQTALWWWEIMASNAYPSAKGRLRKDSATCRLLNSSACRQSVSLHWSKLSSMTSRITNASLSSRFLCSRSLQYANLLVCCYANNILVSEGCVYELRERIMNFMLACTRMNVPPIAKLQRNSFIVHSTLGKKLQQNYLFTRWFVWAWPCGCRAFMHGNSSILLREALTIYIDVVIKLNPAKRRRGSFIEMWNGYCS